MEREIQVGDVVRLTGGSWLDDGKALNTLVTVDSIDSDGDIWAGKAGTVGRNWKLYSKKNPWGDNGDFAVELVTDEEQCAGCDCISDTRDAVKPNHYEFPGGVRVFQISQWLTANIAQAVQYLARSSRIDGQNKGDALEDLQKAKRFIDLEIARLEGENQ